jgi:hypothetical protein
MPVLIIPQKARDGSWYPEAMSGDYVKAYLARCMPELVEVGKALKMMGKKLFRVARFCRARWVNFRNVIR